MPMLGSGLLSSTHSCCPVSKDFQQILDTCPKFNLELQFRRRIFDPWFYNYLDIQLSISLQNEDTKESKPNKQFYAWIESKREQRVCSAEPYQTRPVAYRTRPIWAPSNPNQGSSIQTITDQFQTLGIASISPMQHIDWRNFKIMH